MKFWALFMFAAVLICVVVAEDTAEKKKIWYHAPMFKRPWNKAKTCYKEFRLSKCFADLKKEFKDGVDIFIEKYITTGKDPEGMEQSSQ